MNALLVCDNAEETALLIFLLQEAGLEVCTMPALEPALQLFLSKPKDLIILALRDIPPLDQVRRVRRDTQVCLAVLVEGMPEDELYKAYELGADLLVLRPYSARLLLAQLRALLRRSQGTVLSVLPSMRIGDLELNPTMRTVQAGGRPPRRLTQLEFRLLYTLMLHHGRVVPTEIIVERVWGYSGDGSIELVRGLVRRLRTKIETEPRAPRYVLTVPGIGYRLEADQEGASSTPR